MKWGLVCILVLAACSNGTVDGVADCADPVEWQLAGWGPDTGGHDTPEEAIEAELGRYRQDRGGRVVFVDDRTGSLVVNGREVVVAKAVPAPAGGWLAPGPIACPDL